MTWKKNWVNVKSVAYFLSPNVFFRHDSVVLVNALYGNTCFGGGGFLPQEGKKEGVLFIHVDDTLVLNWENKVV